MGGQFQPGCLVNLVRVAWSISSGFYSPKAKKTFFIKKYVLRQTAANKS
jgi:hypothetical protein